MKVSLLGSRLNPPFDSKFCDHSIFCCSFPSHFESMNEVQDKTHELEKILNNERIRGDERRIKINLNVDRRFRGRFLVYGKFKIRLDDDFPLITLLKALG